MNKKLVIGATMFGVVALASAGIAVNAATLSIIPSTKIGQAPTVLVPTPTSTFTDDKGGLRPDGVSDDATPSPTPTGTPEPGDDNRPSHSGLDDGPNHDVGDDHPGQSNSGFDDDSGSDDSGGDDNGGHGSDD